MQLSNNYQQLADKIIGVTKAIQNLYNRMINESLLTEEIDPKIFEYLQMCKESEDQLYNELPHDVKTICLFLLDIALKENETYEIDAFSLIDNLDGNKELSNYSRIKNQILSKITLEYMAKNRLVGADIYSLMKKIDEPEANTLFLLREIYFETTNEILSKYKDVPFIKYKNLFQNPILEKSMLENQSLNFNPELFREIMDYDLDTFKSLKKEYFRINFTPNEQKIYKLSTKI